MLYKYQNGDVHLIQECMGAGGSKTTPDGGEDAYLAQVLQDLETGH